MTLASLLLVILASFIHATWNLLAKQAAKAGAAFVLAYGFFACVVYAPVAVYLLMTQSMTWSGEAIGFIALSAIIHIGYSLCLQRGYQKADLSVVYPVARGTGPMLSTLGAVLILGEIPTPASLLGLALVVLGIVLIATQGRMAAFSSQSGQAGVGWGMATGGFIASYTVVDAYAVKTLGIAPVILDWFSNLLRCILLMPMALRDRRGFLAAMRGYWWLAAAVGALSPLSYILVLTALSDGAPLYIVAPLREMSMMAGALIGMIVLRERVGRWRLAGCGVLIAGVIFLTSA